MRRIIYPTLLFALVFYSCSSDKKVSPPNYFEGSINYANSFAIKNEKVSPDYLDKIFGKTSELFFKEGNYLELYDKGFLLEQLYRRSENKIYEKKNTSDSLFWHSGAQEFGEIATYELNPKKEVILGITCDEYIVHYKNKTVSYYFNSDTLKIDPMWCKDFTLTNKNVDAEKMGAMYLKYTVDYPDFVFEVTATSIHNSKIDAKIFDLKPNAVLVRDGFYK